MKKLLFYVFLLVPIIVYLGQGHASVDPCEINFELQDIREFTPGSSPDTALNILWNKYGYISKAWEGVFYLNEVPSDGVIVEVAPGFHPKVGLGLTRKFNFTGTYYIVEPELEALEVVTAVYQSLFPHATIVSVPLSLQQSLSRLPTHVDALVANHALDDMLLQQQILGAALEKDPQSVFKLPELSESNVLSSHWNIMTASQNSLEEIKRTVVDEWLEAIEKLHPKLFAVSQYESLFFKRNLIIAPTEQALDVLNHLKLVVGQSSAVNEALLQRVQQDPRNWIIHRNNQDNISSRILLPPNALRRLGENTFVQAPAGKIPLDQVKTVFLDRKLAQHLLGTGMLDHEALSALVIHQFALDLELEPKNVLVHVDRQADPTGYGLNGNEGSGRAAYVGDIFNVKGLGKTPLAVSTEIGNSNGRIGLDKSLWEAVAANTMFENLRTGGSPVIAVLDPQKTYRYFKLSPAIPAGLIVRVDMGMLDRPGHLFLEEYAGEVRSIEKMASNFGRQEGEKFIERIIHGAWSVGNISSNGEMLDAELISSVQGRCPQYSFTGNYVSNYFGFETEGQLQILKKFSEDPRYNEVGYDELEAIFWDARLRQIKNRFPELIGVPAVEVNLVYEGSRQSLEKLTEKFLELSVKMYPQFQATYTGSYQQDTISVFNFSKFFRYFPIIREVVDGKERVALALSLLLNGKPNFKFQNSPKLIARLRSLGRAKAPEEIVDYFESHGYLVTSKTQYRGLVAQATEFIHDYDRFFDEILSDSILSSAERMKINAWVVNEDRVYLQLQRVQAFIKKLVIKYKKGEIDWRRLSDYTTLLIKANNRLLSQGQQAENISDMVLLEAGYMETVIQPHGHIFHRLVLFEDHLVAYQTKYGSRINSMRFHFGNRSFRARRVPDSSAGHVENVVVFESEPRANLNLFIKYDPKHFLVQTQNGFWELKDLLAD